MLTIEMLPAAHGDALLIEYGEAEDVHRILVDGGPYFSYDDSGGLRDRLISLIENGEAKFELLVVTHVDTDHIDGIIRLLQDPELADLEFADIWFNGWRHVRPQVPGVLAGVHGEFLGALLDSRALNWNSHPRLGRGPVVVPDDGELPVLDLPGGARVTLLSPDARKLERLAAAWRDSLRRSGFSPGDSSEALRRLAERARYGPPAGVLGAGPDDSAANGASIAMLLECGGVRVLLTGDAHPDMLERSLQRYAIQHGAPPTVRDFKLPHHGSFSNLTREVIQAVRAERYLISSSSQYYAHPDSDTIDLILMHHSGGVPEFVFNYLSPQTKPWADPERQGTRGYAASFSGDASWGITPR